MTAAVPLAALPDLLRALPTPEARVAALAGMGVFLITWSWFWLYAVTSPWVLARILAIGILSVLGILVTIAFPTVDGMVFTVAAAGAGFRTRPALIVVVALAALGAGVRAHAGLSPAVLAYLINDLVVGFAAIGSRLLLLTNRDLVAARAEVGRLAVNEERLRLARDLHDLIGQNLTVAVLKSELVAGALPADADDRLRGELRDIARVVRRSLDDVRDAVAGYRQPGLGQELVTARAALRAAGVELSVDDGLGSIPSPQETVLAWAVREGVTNVLKHSQAQRCWLRLGSDHDQAIMEMTDDGAGPSPASSGGSGLAGLAERVAAVGGSVAAGPANGRGFRLRVSVPMPA
jgi:two-component system sensor histidine kinase DesK